MGTRPPVSARPYSLDNAALDHVERVYREGMDGHVAFENQLARWQRDHPGAEGLAELADKVGQLRPAYQRVLDLAGQQRANTIEALMSKSDLQVGLEALLGCPTPRQRAQEGGRARRDIFDTLFADDTEQPRDRRGQLATLVFDLIGGYLDADTDRVAQIAGQVRATDMIGDVLTEALRFTTFLTLQARAAGAHLSTDEVPPPCWPEWTRPCHPTTNWP